jgi:hypothetical protein
MNSWSCINIVFPNTDILGAQHGNLFWSHTELVRKEKNCSVS